MGQNEIKKNLCSNKIQYLFNVLKLNKTEFTKLFWNNDSKSLTTRKKTVDNWLNKEIKQPKGFYFEEYNLAKRRLNDGSVAFTKESFLYESFEEFTERVNIYLKDKIVPKNKFKYKYIYYYESDTQQITYVELKAVKKINENRYNIEIILPKKYDEERINTYKGVLEIDRYYYHISATNSFETLSFYFILHLGFKNDDSIYGLRLGKAYRDGLPLSAKNLLTKNKLNEKEKELLYLNMNETEEIKSKEAFYDINSTLKENHLNKFHDKIANLALYNFRSRNILEETLAGDVYHNIMTKEFYAFSRISANVNHRNSFYIHNIQRTSKVFLKSIAHRGEPCYIVSSLSENLTLFNEHDTKAERSLKLNVELAKSGLKIFRIFVYNNRFQINQYIKNSIKQMIDSGISVRMVKEEDIVSIIGNSYDFIYSKSKDIVVYRNPKEKFYLYHVTTNRNVIGEIDIDYKRIQAKSFNFDTFLKQANQIEHTILDKLIGEFFIYSYGSKDGEKEGELYFWNSERIIIDKEGKIQYFQDKMLIATGEISIYEKQSKLHLIDKNSKNSISITFDNVDIYYEVFQIIQRDKQYMENKDMVSVGIFSRKRLDDKTAKILIGDAQKSVFKVPSSIKNNIANYCIKRL